MRGYKYGWLAAVATAAAMGCGSGSAPSPTNSAKPTPALSVANPGDTATVRPTVNVDQINLNQPFSEAVTEESPGNQQLPPDRTMTGLSTGKVRLEVQKLWDSVRFTTSDGKPIAYRAVFTTDSGTFSVALRPEIAPNHVRNFVCLARAGYYNGLVFEHVIHQQGDDTPDSQLDLIEGGCPVGTGEPGVGHLGYWLKPEFSETVLHEPGVLGAFHDDSPESAACRFYVALTKAPAMDGNFTIFGRVETGLDVVRMISKQPNVEGTVQPVKPVVIRSVVIETREGR
ncbi:MAG: peptidylprolyl isomerase [Gemmataceae bacterium]|nr:peptidylprolyl isomerase [Gemmataceae bacterium]